jgi:hypothetical protein
MMSIERLSESEFSEAVLKPDVRADEPLPGDGRQYYQSENEVFVEDNTSNETKYFKGTKQDFGL